MNEVRYIDNPSVDEILETEQTVCDDRKPFERWRSRVVINIILALSSSKHNHNYTRVWTFIVAKANGITVVEFSLDSGPKSIHFKEGETEYSLKELLPFE